MSNRKRIALAASYMSLFVVVVGALMVHVSTSGTAAPKMTWHNPAPVAEAKSEVGAEAKRQPEPVAQRQAVAQSIRPTPSRPTPAPSAQKAPPTPKNVRLRPVTALFSQATIDRGKLVTWMTSPTCLIAGHDNRGWSWLDNVKTGRTVIVETGPCAGTYKVVGHRWQSVKGGPVPAWMSGYDLILQTCTTNGLGFSLLRRQ